MKTRAVSSTIFVVAFDLKSDGRCHFNVASSETHLGLLMQIYTSDEFIVVIAVNVN